ncbi:disease resistance protein RGA2-like [Mangifera indica]|uniref:disease resistance protein RGA2-like n=1 Tax=Mangifera indica TaxID=29780 RepID=UPI001CFAD779|nr:disease resistance protein RGA2-like [Mangifera indica]
MSDKVSLAWGVKNDIQELVDTLITIKTVLLDAEEKQIHNHSLRAWLGNLKAVCYDVEDILDDVEVEDLRKQVVNHQSITRKICHCFSSSNPVAFRFTLGHRIKEIKKRLAKIATDKNNFTLFEKIGSNHVIGWERETHSFVHVSDVIGRDKDKEMIIDFLLHPSDGHENLSVIPIVGIRGLGKTTLARVVYNDKRVSDHFELKMWACVSDEFSLKKLLIDIINSATEEKYIQKNIDQLQTILRDNIRDKKYLLVLDDVWNENYELWCDLRNLLTECVSGSKIIVTTRSDHVVSIMGTVSTYKLKGLSLDQLQKHLPSNGIGCLNYLRSLIIHNCSNLEYLCEDIGRLRVIRRLWIYECPSLISLPRGVRSLSSLEGLGLKDCVRLNLDLSIGSDEQHNHEELNSTGPPLRSLLINNLPQLVELPQWLLRCSTNTLQTLLISNCSKLKALPESMQKLQVLGVLNCPELSSLPKDINYLIALKELMIGLCPKLTERCKPEAGEDWPKIAHIPKIQLDGKIIKSTEN